MRNLPLQRYVDAITIRLRPALGTEWQKWARLEPLRCDDPEQKDKVFPLVLFLACAAVGMIPRAFWRAFPALIQKLSSETKKAANKTITSGEADEEDDEDEDDDS